MRRHLVILALARAMSWPWLSRACGRGTGPTRTEFGPALNDQRVEDQRFSTTLRPVELLKQALRVKLPAPGKRRATEGARENA
jgi:hypothetical protein